MERSSLAGNSNPNPARPAHGIHTNCMCFLTRKNVARILSISPYPTIRNSTGLHERSPSNLLGSPTVY
jgi:hypothetical protein